MRFPSITFVASEAARVWRRFPVTLLLSFVATVVGIIAVEDRGHEDFLVRLLLTAALGLPLSVALSVHQDKHRWSIGLRALIHSLGLILLAGFFFAFPGWNDPVAMRRYLQFSIGCHLMAAFLPYLGLGTKELNGFWQFNKTLFIRFLVSALYAEILFFGLAIAILALDKLFGLDIPEERYFQLWILTGFVFTTWFFLGGVPDDFNRLEASTEYPRGLRIFSQFILLPLVVVYLVILTLYMGKIAITSVWPSGWVGYLVSSVSVIGILLLLLVFPIQGRTENQWIRSYSRWFFIVMLPTVVMLLLAIFKRIGQYGITENRYFMVVLAFWLLAMSLYFVFSRAKSIRLIPTTLCVLAFATSFGPWGAYQVSSRSQTGRLAEMLSQHELLADGKVTRATSEVPFEDRRELSAVVNYILDTHGPDPIESWFESRLSWVDTVGVVEGEVSRWNTSMVAKQLMADELGLDYVEKWAQQDQKHFNYWRPATGVAVSISGYDYSFMIEDIHNASVTIGEDLYSLTYEQASQSLMFKSGERVLATLSLDSSIQQAVQSNPGDKASSQSLDPMIVEFQNDDVGILILIRSLSGYTDDEEGTRITSFSCTGYVRF